MLLAVLFALSPSPFLHASTFSFVPDCSSSGGSLRCYLAGVLDFLYVAAIVLAVLLIGVIALAVKSYRNKKEDEKVGP